MAYCDSPIGTLLDENEQRTLDRFISIHAESSGITETQILMAYLARQAQDLALGINDGIGDYIAMVWAVVMAVDPSTVELSVAASIWDGNWKLGPTIRRLRKALGIYRFEDEELQAIAHNRRTTIANKKAMQRRYVPANSRMAEASRRLRSEPDIRYDLAVRLSAKILGTPKRADKIRCPSCERRSVFFFIKPGRMNSARCSHRNSCGWWGSLYDLARSS